MPDYLRGFQGGDLREFTDPRNQSMESWSPPQLSNTDQNLEGALFSEFESIYGQQAGPISAPHLLDGQHLNLFGFFLTGVRLLSPVFKYLLLAYLVLGFTRRN